MASPRRRASALAITVATAVLTAACGTPEMQTVRAKTHEPASAVTTAGYVAHRAACWKLTIDTERGMRQVCVPPGTWTANTVGQPYKASGR